jgi:hypothetical protein
MSDFWDSFTAGADAIIEIMGEDVVIGGRDPIQGVVQPVETRPGIVAGGISAGVTHLIQVSLADGELVADGDEVVSRSFTGAVVSKTHFGGGWMIQGGPENRGAGEDW